MSVEPDRGPSPVRLTRFDPHDLDLALPWFDDPVTTRWLGGTNWLRLMVAMADLPLVEFRGANETGRYRWLAWSGEEPVGYADCGTFDRWTTWDGQRVRSAIEIPSGAIAFTVAPNRRRRGHGVSVLRALQEAPELSKVELLGAGVDPENTASIRSLRAAGFVEEFAEPDFEGMLYFLWRR